MMKHKQVSSILLGATLSLALGAFTSNAFAQAGGAGGSAGGSAGVSAGGGPVEWRFRERRRQRRN